jgi:hypothetical protein
MASTYTDRLGLEKQTDGENPNSWGAILNTNVIDLIDDAIAGYEIVSVSSTGITLTDNQGSTDQSRNAALEFAGTLTANVTITVPAEEKTYFVRENTSGSFAVQMKTVGGTALTLVQGKNTFVACNGTSIYQLDAPTSVDSFTANTINTSILNVSTSALFADNVKANFGTGNDLQVFHDGSNSYIQDIGTGHLYISGSQVNLRDSNNEIMVNGIEDGAVNIYYNANLKLATTNTGAQVTGTLLATTNTDTSNTGSVTLDFAANQNFVLTLTGNLTLANPTTEQVGQAGVITFIQDATGSRTLTLGTQYKTRGGSGITLSTAANAVDVVPYFVQSSDNILLGAVQKAFS